MGRDHSESPKVLSPRALYLERLRATLRAFVQHEVLPAEVEYERFIDEAKATPSSTSSPHGPRWGAIPPVMERLKARAKQLGLWNLFLPADHPEWASYSSLSPTFLCGPPSPLGPLPSPAAPSPPSPLLSNAEYAPLAEEMGWSPLASEACNCSAPDTGNMEVLIKYGSRAQQERWLLPLLRGTIRSAFLMTEPAVASSDASNIQTAFRKVAGGGEYSVTGRKWWSTGALHPDCELFLVLGRVEGSDALPRHQQHTVLIVPRASRGVRVLRPLTVFGYDDAPEGHAEVDLADVRVPAASSVVLGEGKGFEISQGRLGPGRVHHCMRAIGLAERCHAQMLSRAGDPARVAFGRPLWQHATTQAEIAENRLDIEASRQTVLHCAALIDSAGPKRARKEIALIKVLVPRLCLRVVDRAIQLHGGAGVSQDTCLARAWAGLRSLRIVDGPDVVHLRTVALLELKDGLARRAGTTAADAAAALPGKARL
jgi:acyl-CoA dehydrogenase